MWFVGERPELAAIYNLLGNGLLISIVAAVGDALTMGAAAGVDANGLNELFAHFNPGTMLPYYAKRVARSDKSEATFPLDGPQRRTTDERTGGSQAQGFARGGSGHGQSHRRRRRTQRLRLFRQDLS